MAVEPVFEDGVHCHRFRMASDRCVGADGQPLTSLIDGLEEGLRRGLAVRWNDVRTVELVLDEIAVEFDGEDALKPSTRLAQDGARRSPEWIAPQLEVYGEAVEFREPSEDELEEMRNFVEKGRRLVS